MLRYQFVTESGKQSNIEWMRFYIVYHFYQSLKKTFNFCVKCFARKTFSVYNRIHEFYVWRHLYDSCFKTFLFPSIAPAPSVHTPTHSLQDSPSSFSLLSSFVKMSSPVHVLSSGVQNSMSSSSLPAKLYLTNTSSWGEFDISVDSSN